MNLMSFVPTFRILTGIMFLYSGLVKLPDLKKFSVIVASYGLLPRKLVKPLAYLQPFIETFIGLWIISGVSLLYAAIAGLLMILVADIFVIKGYIQKKKMDNCGCYGANIEVPLDWKKLLENAAWTAVFILFVIAVI